MEIVVDTCALLAVILGEPERARIVDVTSGHSLVAPASIQWEVGNVFSALMKRRRFGLAEAKHGIEIFHDIPLRVVGVDMERAIILADRARIYAYDAYFIECAIRRAAPLLTLDRRLRSAAVRSGASVLEVLDANLYVLGSQAAARHRIGSSGSHREGPHSAKGRASLRSDTRERPPFSARCARSSHHRLDR